MYADSAWSLAVPLCVIVLVFLTRRVVLSLLVGIVLAGILMTFSPMGTVEYAFFKILDVFYERESSELNLSSFYVFGFLIVLGVLTQVMFHSGGIAAFVSWAKQRIKTARNSEFLAFVAGIVIFIDDYFNALAVGQISKSINDANHSTRERLAYIIDSTAAPVCILMPLSSWGAYIIGIMNGLIEGQSSFMLLITSIWANFYAWFALLAVFLTIQWQINLPAMRKNQNIGVSDFLNEDLEHKSSLWLLLIPIASLLVFIIAFLLYSGYEVVGSFDVIAILAETQTAFSLFWGGLCSLLVALLCSFKQLKLKMMFPIIKDGFMAMLPANCILVFAWAIGPIIKQDMQTGIYLANISKEWLSSGLLAPSLIVPVMIFIVSGFIAFCTGTSWGTFAIMLPIGVAMADANNTDAMLAISATLSGAVYGDHTSPISDTTILSATGAGCSVQSHFITQLPYATSTAFVALLCFGVSGISHSLLAGYAIGLIGLVGLFGFYKKHYAI